MKALVVFALLHLPADALFAQTEMGSLAGRLTDRTGGVISNAVVTIRNVATSMQRSAVSDAQGLYRSNLLPPGVYEVSTEVAGFKRFVDREVRIQVAQPT